jgi:hypothetical protein
MDAICSSETSVDFQRTTGRYVTEDGSLRNYGCENLKSYTVIIRLGGSQVYYLYPLK